MNSIPPARRAALLVEAEALVLRVARSAPRIGAALGSRAKPGAKAKAVKALREMLADAGALRRNIAGAKKLRIAGSAPTRD